MQGHNKLRLLLPGIYLRFQFLLFTESFVGYFVRSFVFACLLACFFKDNRDHLKVKLKVGAELNLAAGKDEDSDAFLICKRGTTAETLLISLDPE